MQAALIQAELAGLDNPEDAQAFRGRLQELSSAPGLTIVNKTFLTLPGRSGQVRGAITWRVLYCMQQCVLQQYAACCC